MVKFHALFVSGAVLACTAACANAAPAPPPVVSNSTVTISGPGIGGATKTCSLPFMNNFANKGDWYVLPDDAHAAFFVADKSPYSQCSVDILLNGAQKTFDITSANDLATGHKTDLAFGVRVGDGHSNKTFSTTDPGDAVTVLVTKMDMLNFEATFSGTMTEVGMMERDGHEAHRVTVSGVISLHRTSAPSPINAGNWTACDPIVHDWLNQAQNRASSDCEVKFDHHLEIALDAAFSPMESAFTASEWQIVNKPDPSVLFDSAPRGSEHDPFHGQGFKLTMTVDPNSAQGQQAMAAENTPDPMMVKMMELMKEGKYAEAQELQKQLDAKSKNAPPPPSTRIDRPGQLQLFRQGADQLPRSLQRFRTSRRRHGALSARHAGIRRRIWRRSRHLGSAWRLEPAHSHAPRRRNHQSHHQSAAQSLRAAPLHSKHHGLSQLRPRSGGQGDLGNRLEPAASAACPLAIAERATRAFNMQTQHNRERLSRTILNLVNGWWLRCRY